MGLRKVLIFALSAAVLLTGCQTKNEKKSYRVGRNARGNVSNTYQVPGQYSTGGAYGPTQGKSWGEITRGSSSQYQFQNAVTTLLSAQGVTPGYVSGDSSQSTGIRFWGNAEATTGAINVNNYGQNYSIAKGSARIRIAIYDEWVGQVINGQVVSEIPIDIGAATEGFVNAGGYIQGNYAQIAFQDTIGWIILDGSFNASYFTGYVWFGPGDGQMSLLGQFTIPTCGFFRCY